VIQAEPCQPIELVVVQATAFCNLNCTYCYLSEETRKTKDKIPLSLISTFFSKILSSKYLGDRLIVSWHSGEPLVLGHGYYESAIEIICQLKEQYCAPDFEILHDIQTNGTLIDEGWCSFFNKYKDIVTVGVSCDGPDYMHDAYRRDWRKSGTFKNTRKGMDLLIANNIKFSLIAVISPNTLDYPNEFFDFFYSYRSNITGFRFNLLDVFSESGEFSYKDAKEKYYAFLRAILDRMESLDPDDELLKIRNFSHFYNRLFSTSDEKLKLTAHYTSLPFRAFNIATNGDVSTFYAGLTIDECGDVYGDGEGLVLGNLINQGLDDIAASPKLARIMRDFQRSHTACQEECPYFDLCPGGYNLIKFKRFGTFAVAETPECKIQVKTFSDALLDHINDGIKVESKN
jgi:uncharacterized protein